MLSDQATWAQTIYQTFQNQQMISNSLVYRIKNREETGFPVLLVLTFTKRTLITNKICIKSSRHKSEYCHWSLNISFMKFLKFRTYKVLNKLWFTNLTKVIYFLRNWVNTKSKFKDWDWSQRGLIFLIWSKAWNKISLKIRSTKLFWFSLPNYWFSQIQNFTIDKTKTKL